MFGIEYANNLDILTESFGQINEQYKEKIHLSKKGSIFNKVKKIYVLLFGIPEIGFQIRAMYFKKILFSNLVEKGIKNILDAGCGIGAYTFWLGKKFPLANVVGGDIDKQKLQSCKQLSKELQSKNVIFSYIDITQIKTKETYDLIVSIDVLEHIENYQQVLKNFHNLLRLNGYLYIHVPQPNQKRIFGSLRTWHHQYHIREGIAKKDLENSLEKLGYKIIVSKKTFGLFGKLAWELNHMSLSKNFFIAGIIYPLLYGIAKMDIWQNNNNGLGIAVLAKKE